ncbi:uncharacterized protein LOC108108087 [Drosophila eugracilis]|uniref:uncharacterized protein LOC108108087 n=1 Tax=Drosophila eugracilis TaxID=29029 RepID=UPI001BD99F6B|nr:uncharacterized protein LOC108108087 [Drosophila eugracilis]
MESIAVGLAAFFELMGCQFFLPQPKDRCSPAPDLASWIFLAATVCLLWDISIYPRRFMHMGRAWRVLVETMAAIFIAELGTIVIWCGIERFLYGVTDEILHLIRNSCRPSPYLYWISGLITTFVSGAFLYFVLRATDSIYYINKFVLELWTTIKLSLRMLRCYMTMNTRGRRQALKVCQLTGKMTNRRSSSRRCSTPKEEEYNSD